MSRRQQRPRIYVDMRDFPLYPTSQAGSFRSRSRIDTGVVTHYGYPNGPIVCPLKGYWHPNDTLAQLVEMAAGLTDDEAIKLSDAVRYGGLVADPLLIVVSGPSRDNVVALRYEGKYIFLGSTGLPRDSAAWCGCVPSCPMPRPVDFVRGTFRPSTCPSEAITRGIYRDRTQDQLHGALANRRDKYRVMALCEMLIEGAIVREVAKHLPVEHLPELVAEYALEVFQRTRTVYRE